MKVAVCLSGEPRTYEVCAPSIKTFFGDVDYFIRALDSNHWAMKSSEKYNGKYFDKECLDVDKLRNNLHNLFNPKSLVIASEPKLRNNIAQVQFYEMMQCNKLWYRDWETDRKSTRLNSSHITRSRMPSSA